MALEAEIFEDLDVFVESMHQGMEPNMRDVAIPQAALNGLARIYGQSNKSLSTIDFGKPQEAVLRKIALLQEEGRKLESLGKKKQREAEILGIQIAEIMAEHERGELAIPGGFVRAEYITKNSRRVDRDLLKDKYPAIHDEVYLPSSSRKLKVYLETA